MMNSETTGKQINRKPHALRIAASVVLLLGGVLLVTLPQSPLQLAALAQRGDKGPPPQIGGEPPMPTQTTRDEVAEVRVEPVARNLEIVWAINFAPDGRMFFTERPGRIQVMKKGEAPRLYHTLADVAARGEGGLMGMALHPQFPREPYIYVSYTANKNGRRVNRVSRLRDEGDKAGTEEILLDDIAAANNHDGGALAFGPDGMLYIGTGDAALPPRSQDLKSPNGKVLRLTATGKIPDDNPFPDSPVWAYGLRNVTGLAWHPETKQLWAASHGPSGEFRGIRARDSVYVVRKGANLGWPLVVGTSDNPEITPPVLYYPERSVPPGGSIFYSGKLFPQFRNNYFLATLASQHLQRVVVGKNNAITTIERWWPNKYGRLRAITQGPNGEIYLSTSNRDGRVRGDYPESDTIYRIVPAIAKAP